MQKELVSDLLDSVVPLATARFSLKIQLILMLEADPGDGSGGSGPPSDLTLV